MQASDHQPRRIRPDALADAERIHGPALFVGLLFWGWLWGTWGKLLAYPLMMMLKIIVDHISDFRVASELLSE